MKSLIGSCLALSLLAAPALGQQHAHGHQKGPKGGEMLDVAGVHAEILHQGPQLTLNIYDEGGKPFPTAGFTGSALMVSGAERETVTLAPSGENMLTGTAKKPVAAKAALTFLIKTAAGKSGQVRYTAHAD